MAYLQFGSASESNVSNEQSIVAILVQIGQCDTRRDGVQARVRVVICQQPFVTASARSAGLAEGGFGLSAAAAAGRTNISATLSTAGHTDGASQPIGLIGTTDWSVRLRVNITESENKQTNE